MNVITYRGPGMSGGLSSSIGRAWQMHADPKDLWWHLNKNDLQVLTPGIEIPEEIAEISAQLVDSHYRYSNEFLWPVMHDLSEYSICDLEAEKKYELFNLAVSHALSDAFSQRRMERPTCFIHDYHFALVPRYLKKQVNARSIFFWHIPWPKMTENVSLNGQLKNIARGILDCETIGFHIQEYANNFMHFVEANLPQYLCDWNNKIIFHAGSASNQFTKILVAPLGVDYEFWNTLAQQESEFSAIHNLHKQPYVLSVDWADYTKGVVNRLEAIDCFFKLYPQWLEKVTFVQSCGQTRPGLPVFDEYWQECHQFQKTLDKNLGNENWQPVIWLKDNLSNKQLAPLYRDAAVMLVNPIKDGLNLTAKEFIACQLSEPGVLALSPGAGAWEELGRYSINIDPKQPESMAHNIHHSLSLRSSEKSLRMSLLRDSVQANTLAKWWYQFKSGLDRESVLYFRKSPKRENSVLSATRK